MSSYLVFALMAMAGVVAGDVIRQPEPFNYMALQFVEAERLSDLPDLPHLIQNLGLDTLYNLVGQAGLAQALSANGRIHVLLIFALS
jgi:hypothetical protein